MQACDLAVAEFYTAMLAGTTHEELEAVLGCKVMVLDREAVELGGKDLVAQAANQDVAFLTAGDPMAATTHTDLVIRARASGVKVTITHAPSILSAAPGLLGLQHYKFGRTSTLVRPEPNWMPTSPFDAVEENHQAGLHTLVLLDIKAHEEPAYFMSAHEGLNLLLQLAELTGHQWFNETLQVGVVARAGSDDATVVTGTVAKLLEHDMGGPLHCIVVPGLMQVVETEAWQSLAL